MPSEGIEPPTSNFEDWRSIRLSYEGRLLDGLDLPHREHVLVFIGEFSVPICAVNDSVICELGQFDFNVNSPLT